MSIAHRAHDFRLEMPGKARLFVLLPSSLNAAGQTNMAATNRDVGTMDLRDGHRSAYLQSPRLDETFGVNSAFNAEVFVTPPHTVAMEFNMLAE
jgi:hypothetical protein